MKKKTAIISHEKHEKKTKQPTYRLACKSGNPRKRLSSAFQLRAQALNFQPFKPPCSFVVLFFFPNAVALKPWTSLIRFSGPTAFPLNKKAREKGSLQAGETRQKGRVLAARPSLLQIEKGQRPVHFFPALAPKLRLFACLAGQA